jgi:hypothetical protein
MSHHKGDCFDSDNESLPDDSEIESGDEVAIAPPKKGENDKKRQILPHQTVSSSKSYLHTQN